MLGILKEAKVGKAEKFGHGNSKIGCLAPCQSNHFLNYTIGKIGYILSLNAKALLMLFSNHINIGNRNFYIYRKYVIFVKICCV